MNKIKWLLNARKAGHAGTLDPDATGILAIDFGEATKTIPYVTDAPKTYRFRVNFGSATDTDDASGHKIKESKIRPTNSQLENILEDFWEKAESTFKHTHPSQRKGDSPQVTSIIDFNSIGKKNLLEGEDIPLPSKDDKIITFTPLSILIQSREYQRSVCEEYLGKNRTILIFPLMKNRERVNGVFRCVITNKR